MVATESAVLVTVPEAEPVVGAVRARLDRSAGWGVPAHVTVLYPFVPPDLIDATVLAALAEAVATVPVFDLTLPRVAWFGEEVVWLAPEPSAGFVALTSAVWGRFPEYPPYRNAHPEVIPHLTLGDRAPVDELRAAAREVAAGLPIRSRVTHVRLMEGAPEPNSWRTVAELGLSAVS